MVVDFVVVEGPDRFVAAADFFGDVVVAFLFVVRRAGVGAGRATSAACSARNDS